MSQNILSDPTYWLLPLALSMLIMFKMSLKRQRKDNGILPPSPHKLPLIGNLHQIGSQRHISLAKLASTYGPVMLLDFGYKPVVFVSSAEAAKDVLKTHDIDFCSKPNISSAEMLSYNYSDIGFSSYSESWAEMRKICAQQLFTQKRVESFLPVRVREMEDLINSIMASASRTEPVNISEKLYGLTANVTFEAAFGTNLKERKMDGYTVRKLILDAQGLLMYSAADFFPHVGWIADRIAGRQSKLDRVFKKLNELYEQLIDEHTDINRTASDQEDFIDLLLQLKKESDESGRNWFTRNHIKGVLDNIFTGAIGSTASVLTWAMTELARHPDIMRKAQEEIRTSIGKKAELLTLNDMENLSYLDMVLKETFRLHPLVPLISRASRTTSKIIDYKIPQNTEVYINIYAIGRDPKIYNQPETFSPERFKDSLVDYKGQHFELLPFGSGRRMCPAINLGMSTVELVLANLLYWFDWKLPDGLNPEDITVEEAVGVTSLHKVPLMLVPIKHNFNDPK